MIFGEKIQRMWKRWRYYPIWRYSTQKLEKFETEKNITIHGGMLILPDYTNSLKVLPIILLYINLLNLFQQKAREDTLMNR
jgi:hypothetical protein